MENYKELLKYILTFGESRIDRTGTGTFGVWFETLHFQPTNGFPMLPLRYISLNTVFHELMFFIKGETNTKYLKDNKVTIWDSWADLSGNLGPVYGKQWRDWNGHDQLNTLLINLKEDPFSRRHVISAWNVSDLSEMALPPCHYTFQCYVKRNNYKGYNYLNSNEDYSLNMVVHMRSSDVVIGLPHNIAEYSLLLHLMCNTLGYALGELTLTLGDVHIYSNHVDGAWEMTKRKSLELPTLRINTLREKLEDYVIDDIELINYNYHDKIKFPLAI